jgi:curved DNA-binding protein CbpA
MPGFDLYKVLQIDPSAEFDVIRAAYRVLAARHHPDVGGSAERMAELNRAWSVLSDPERRADYDRERRLRVNGDRWDAYAPPAQRLVGTVLEYGRYAGWSIPEVARVDPDFLEWLARHPSGRRYRSEIDQVLSSAKGAAAPAVQPRTRRGRW